MIEVHPFTRREYGEALEAMRRFTAERSESTPDAIWLTEHPAVFTLGLAGRMEHVLDPGEIAVWRTERGGQVTYHGPGQVVAYTLIDLRRRPYGVRDLVCRLEQAVIELCAQWAVQTARRPGAPGVYLTSPAGAKIASLGLKVSRGCTFHGVALNVDMDLSPFERIHPCGYAGQAVTDLKRESPAQIPPASEPVSRQFGERLASCIDRP